MHGKQKLNLFSFTMIVVGLVIGMGIFRTAATSAKHAIEPSVYFTAWLLGGFFALCGALTYAEIGSRYPVTGGYYKIFSYAYHPSIAFAINCIILISNAASLSGVALIGSGYIAKLFPSFIQTDIDKALLSCAAILVFYLINLRGLRMSSRAQNMLMLIKIGMIVVLILALFFPHQDVAATAAVASTPVPEMSWIQSLGVSLIAVSFTYGGYQQTINFGNEVDKPAKNIPRGIFIGIAIIIGLYLLANLSYYSIVGFDNMKAEKEIAYVLMEKVFGKTGADIFAFFLFFGVLAYVNALLMSNPRVMYAMSNEGVLPKVFSRQNPKNEVLTISLTVFAAMCIIILFFAQTFDKILNFTIFLDCFGMVASSATIFVLRKRTRHLDGTGIFKMKFYPWIPLIFMGAYLFVGISIAMQTPDTALVGAAVLAAFMVIYFISKKLNPAIGTDLSAKDQ
ncbi:MAG: APC family permease [Chitinophagaceae bacterium]|nr:APC family permease [Chitinophagaceae bacterium]MEA3426803.1 APC family permease [Bacteroidota bacterium]MCA6454490.1 APC family permease [Chitinophagaceae bacterium]MCA6456618.1 APC family permease [Chitinophagaceae bacterium]MCA6459893.1 APC family permease [Chitinophagaceae bacterium]